MSDYGTYEPRRTLDELRALVGTEYGVSRWIEITQGMIDRFADLTIDHQFIHVDPEKAKETPFGGTIAHGFLTLSMLSTMIYEAGPALKGLSMGVNYGCDKLRFLNPVRAGARIRGRFFLDRLDESRPGEVTYYNTVTMDIEGEEKPALVAQWIGRAYLEAA